MAGGIDWFRWHHGSVTDPKFQLVARKAGATLPDVLAVWAYVLEGASANSDRGSIGEVDAEALDCLFAFPDTETRTANILVEMGVRGLIVDGRIAAWDKRQPKREREDDTAAERKRRQRERDAEADTHGQPDEDMSHHVTPNEDASRQVTTRGEERREEQGPTQEPSALVDDADAPSTTYRVPSCPSEALVALYHRHLPALPAVEVMNAGRKRGLAARWRDVCADGKLDRAGGIDFFDWFFKRVGESDFLMGRAAGRSGRIWRADFDFLTTASKFVRVVEGAYHQEGAKA